MSFSASSLPPPPPPPPPAFLLKGIGGGTVVGADESRPPSSSSMDGIKPSLLIIILILSITVLISVSLCLLLRHLNRRCLRHLSRSSASSAANTSSRVSPEQTQTSTLLDSLPLFTFSSITRRSTNTTATAASVVSGDCAVCLSKFEPQDQLRLLPLCCHAFHTDCIDTWISTNQTCPLCRSPIYASESDLRKLLLQSDAGAIGGVDIGDSFTIEIGSVSRRHAGLDSGEQRRSYSIGSFDYIVDVESEVSMNHTHQRSVSDKEELGGAEGPPEASLAAEVASGRSWLKDYVDRLSFSVSSRALSFRSSGRFFTGSSRRSDVSVAGEWDMEANRVGEEISELFRWFSGV